MAESKVQVQASGASDIEKKRVLNRKQPKQMVMVQHVACVIAIVQLDYLQFSH
jgi:hypothetical protein